MLDIGKSLDVSTLLSPATRASERNVQRVSEDPVCLNLNIKNPKLRNLPNGQTGGLSSRSKP